MAESKEVLEHGVFLLRPCYQRHYRHRWQERNNMGQLVWNLFGSLRSAITKRAMCANVEAVSVMSRFDGFSKSNSTGV
jgi:hypothetical protein